MINVIAAASWAMPAVGCAIQLPILQIGAAMYVAYGLLFARLFVERYSRKAEGDGAKNGSNGAHHANGNGASDEPPGLKAPPNFGKALPSFTKAAARRPPFWYVPSNALNTVTPAVYNIPPRPMIAAGASDFKSRSIESGKSTAAPNSERNTSLRLRSSGTAAPDRSEPAVSPMMMQ